MGNILQSIQSPADLQDFSIEQLKELATEMRNALCDIVSDKSAHFASNLGVVELCLALHTTYDFSKDKLIWDTGHQIYPQKLITGRYDQIHTIREKGGLMGYPNPAESLYDLFMTGHAGSSISTSLGLKVGDRLTGHPERHSVTVIGDGAFPSGIVYEAMNNASGLDENLTVILNDNQMSICPRTGGLAKYFDHLRTSPMYEGLKSEVHKILKKFPHFIGDPTERFIWQVKDRIKAGLNTGMLFEELGFRYLGPIDGHDIEQLKKYLELVKEIKGPVLLHVFTTKGQGFKPAEEDPVKFHAPAPFERSEHDIISIRTSSSRAYTNAVSESIYNQMEKREDVAVITAAMCQGNKLDRIRDEFEDRFFDVGICESHAVAFAAGMAKSGMHPIVDIYSTFMQRSFDQIFQEVSLQNLPVTLAMDRAGLSGPDGPTHHGAFDIGYVRMFPNMVCMAPGDGLDVEGMMEFAMNYDGPTSLRYPKASLEEIERTPTPVKLGQAEVIEPGTDGTIIACGALLPRCVEAVEILRKEGHDIGVINARFIKPLDKDTILRAIRDTGFVITVEEGVLSTGFGSAVLEAANEASVDTSMILRLGIPDQFVEHGDRNELLADLGLHGEGIAESAREMLKKLDFESNHRHVS